MSVIGPITIECPGCGDEIQVPILVGPTERGEGPGKMGHLTVNIHPDLDFMAAHLTEDGMVGDLMEDLLTEIEEAFRDAQP